MAFMLKSARSGLDVSGVLMVSSFEFLFTDIGGTSIGGSSVFLGSSAFGAAVASRGETDAFCCGQETGALNTIAPGRDS